MFFSDIISLKWDIVYTETGSNYLGEWPHPNFKILPTHPAFDSCHLINQVKSDKPVIDINDTLSTSQ